jgi:hypothetical protein
MRKLAYVFLIALTSCQTGFYSEKEFFSWLSDEANGLVKSRDFDQMKIRMKYLPDEYLVYNELKRIAGPKSAEVVDSLKAMYADTRTFLMTFEFEQDFPGENVLLYGLDSYEDYKERIERLNFDADNYFRVETGTEEYKPVLWTLENSLAPGNKKNLYLVFPKEKNGDQRLSILFEDLVFETGISRYVFDKEKLDQVPSLTFIETFLKQQ